MGYKGADLKIPGKSCGIRRKANKGAGLSAEPNRPNLGPARKPLQGVYNLVTLSRLTCPAFANI